MASDRRLQVDPGLRTPGIQPVAAPVDSFVRPTAGDKLGQLGSALSQISPEVQRFAGVLTDNIDANAQQEGRLAAEKLREQGLTLADATRKGVLPASKNPWYVAGLREQLGRNMADKYEGDLRAAMAQDENLQTSTNIKDFDTFTKNFRDQWQKENIAGGDQDQHFNTGFAFRAAAYENAQRNEFAGGIEQKVKQQGDQATFAEVYKHVQWTAGKFDPEQVGADLNAVLDDLIQKQGRNGTIVMQTAAKAIAAAANDDDTGHGLQILDVMKHMKGKYGMFIASPAASSLYAEMRDKVTQNMWEQNQREAAQAKAAQQARTDGVLDQAVKELVSNPNADLRKYLPSLQGDPQATEQLASLARNIGTLTFKTDEPVKQRLFANIWTGSGANFVSRSTVIRAMNQGQLTVGDASFLNEQITARDAKNKENSPENKIFKDFVFLHQLEGLKGRFADATTGVVAGENAERAAHAQATLIDQWLQKSLSGAVDKMSPTERSKWLNDTADQIAAYERSGTTFGSEGFRPGPAAPIGVKDIPSPLEKRLPTKLVITPQDALQFSQGNITSTLKAAMEQYHILPGEQAEFMRNQIDFFRRNKKKTQ